MVLPAVYRRQTGRAMRGMVVVVVACASSPGADRDHQVLGEAMKVKLVVIVKVFDKEVTRFETELKGKDSIAFVYKGYQHVTRDGDTITFEVPLTLR